MNPVQLLAHFNRISDAPDAIIRLRQFILDLAVQGKLVEQDPRDEPASELLKRIENDAREREVCGEFTEPRNAIEIAIESLPFNVPYLWRWARLIEIADVSYGFAFESSRFNSNKVGMPLIRIRDISSTDTEAYYQGKFEPTYVVCKGDYLVGMDGDFNVRNWKGPDALLNQRVMRIKNWRAALVAEFLAIPLQMILNYLHFSTSQTTVKHLSAKQVNGIYLPIPPLAEQHRIVAKLDELMALCDRLEAAQAERESRQDRLAAASLHRLNNGPAAAAFHDHVRFYFNQLPRLTMRSTHIQQLRQTILNLAVRGKLTPQDPNDEPEEELAEPPAKKSAPQKGDRGAPFELPATWQWMQLGQVSELINGDRSKNYPNKAEYVREGVAWINTGHIEPDGTLSTDSMHYITRKKFDSLRSGKVRPGDLIYCLRGATLGKTAIITQFDEGAVASSLVIVRLSFAIDPRFAYQVLTSPLGREQIFQFDNGSAQPNLSANNVKKYWIPIPPLAEQHRIVAKVEELMALCDRLEVQLTTTQTESRRLLEAVLHETLTPAV